MLGKTGKSVAAPGSGSQLPGIATQSPYVLKASVQRSENNSLAKRGINLCDVAQPIFRLRH